MIILKGNDYVKYMTQQVVSYMDLPKDERKKRRTETKAQKHQPPIGNRWFGALPVAVRYFFKKAD